MKKSTPLLAALFTSGLFLTTAGRAAVTSVPPESSVPHKHLLAVKASGLPGLGSYQGILSVGLNRNRQVASLIYCDTLSQTSCRIYSPKALKAGIEPINVMGAGSLLRIRSPKFGTDLMSEVTVEFKSHLGDWRVLHLRAGQASGASPFIVELDDEKNHRLTQFNQLGLRVAIFPIGMKSVSFGLNDKEVAKFQPGQLDKVQ